MTNLVIKTHVQQENTFVCIYETQEATGTRYEVIKQVGNVHTSYTTQHAHEAADMYFDFLGQTSFFTRDEDERTCKVCNTPMSEGFVLEETGDTWCSETCLRTEWTEEEQAEAYDEDGGGLYWTEWEDGENLHDNL